MQFVKMNFLALLMLPLWLRFTVKENREITQKSCLGLHPYACCQPQPQPYSGAQTAYAMLKEKSGAALSFLIEQVT